MVIYQVTSGCVLCGECRFSCPVGAITMDKNGAHIDAETCVGCGTCADDCASEAITAVEKESL